MGNRDVQTTTGLSAGVINYTYDDRDRLLTETGTVYGYDDNGNLTSKSAEATYSWDFENRLIRVEKTDGTVVTHAYDVDGVRVRTETTIPGSGTTVTNFLVDINRALSHVVAETDDAGDLLAYYVRGAGDLLSVIRPTETRYYHADGLGSIRFLTDEVGSVTDTYEYTAFGERLEHVGTDPQPYQFAGEPFEPNIGFYYNRARWLDPSVGRFQSQDPFAGDPFEPFTLHRYLYVGNDPANRLDPSGLTPNLVTLGIALSVMTTVLSTSVVRAGSVFGLGSFGRRWTLYLRSFAPWKTFGGGFGGDNRSFTTSLAVTSRIIAQVVFDRPENRLVAFRVRSDRSHWGPLSAIGRPDVDVMTDSRGITLRVAGANPIMQMLELPVFDIDLELKMSISEDGQGRTCFAGSLVGDGFPNAEVFVTDQIQRATTLHTFETSGGRNEGPFRLLPGDNRRAMGSFRKCPR